MIGSIMAGMIGKGGADAAASGINSAASNANFQNQQAAKENRSNLSPWTSTGTAAIGQIGSLLGYGALWNRGGDGATYNYETDPNAQGNALSGLLAYAGASGATLPTYMPTTFKDSNVVSENFTADPSYAWRLSEGMKALDRTAASKGKLLSGQQIKGAQEYNSGLASQEYGNWYSRLDNQNRYNLQGNLATNAQNFGQQQQIFQDQYGQWRDAVGDVFNASGAGLQATNSLTGQNSQLAQAGGNALLGGAKAAGDATMMGTNALASGISSGINNTLSAAWMGFNPTSGIFNGGGSPATTTAASIRTWAASAASR